jgi:hypothetical protein
LELHSKKSQTQLATKAQGFTTDALINNLDAQQGFELNHRVVEYNYAAVGLFKSEFKEKILHQPYG